MSFAALGKRLGYCVDERDWNRAVTVFRCRLRQHPRVLDDNRARGLAVAGGSLYVTHAYSAAIEAFPTSGCASPANLLWSDEPWSPNTETIAVAADATDVYGTTRYLISFGCERAASVRLISFRARKALPRDRPADSLIS